MMKKLAIVSTHPIQYNAPFFKLLAQRGHIGLKVFYTQSHWKDKVLDVGFKKEISWDLPLLDGYEHCFVDNISNKPDTKHYGGVDCPAILDEISAYSPDAVLVFGWNLKAHWKVIRHFKNKIPVYFRGDSTLLDEQPGWRTWLRRLVLTWVYRQVDAAFYVGTENKKYFLKHGLKESQLVYAPHAVDNERFSQDQMLHEANADRLASEYGLDRSKLSFLFAGKFERKKNPLLLLQLALEEQFRDIQFVFVGNGELEEQMKAMASGHANVLFLPFQNQSLMPAVYRLARFFVLPSRGPGETWGLAVNEAMVSGAVPIVSDKVGCAADLIAGRESGFIFPSNDRAALRSILQQLVSHPELWDGWTENARKVVSSHHYTAVAQAIEKRMGC